MAVIRDYGVIQKVNMTTASQVDFNTSNSWVEASTGFRNNITPVLSGSKIHGEFYVCINQTGGTNKLVTVKFQRSINNGSWTDISDLGIANSSQRKPAIACVRPYGYDANDATDYYWSFTDSPSTTQNVNYRWLIFGGDGPPGWKINYSSGGTSGWSWTAPLTFMLTEIGQ